MKNVKMFIKNLALLMALCLIVGIAGCGQSEAVSSEPDEYQNILYGNAVDEEDDDDVVTSGGSSESTGTGLVDKNNTDKTGSTTGTVGKPSNNYEINEEETKSFLESVPKSLSGTTVRVLIWWTPGVTESAKAEAFEKATGIKIKFVQTGLGGEYQTKLTSLIQQKNSPDLACINQVYYPAVIMQNNF